MYHCPVLTTSSSELSLEQYHAYSDATMETLLDSLENLLDTLGNPEYEVEYSVRLTASFLVLAFGCLAHCARMVFHFLEWSPHTEAGTTRYICD